VAVHRYRLHAVRSDVELLDEFCGDRRSERQVVAGMDAVRCRGRAVHRSRRHDPDEESPAEGTARRARAGAAAQRVHLSAMTRGALAAAIVVLALSATGHGQPASREAQARAPIDAFFAAFNARDNEALRRTLHYPHVRINEAGGVNIWHDQSEANTNF